jgi:hypothetical protein
MIIHYQVRRFDLVKVYFYNVIHSPRTRMVVLGVAAAIFALVAFLGYRSDGKLTPAEVFSACSCGIGYLLLTPALMFLTAKTQPRTLQIDSEGIQTTIGKKQGRIPWKAVESITSSGDQVFITGKNANAFAIPPTAFNNEEGQQTFVRLATQYKQDADR